MGSPEAITEHPLDYAARRVAETRAAQGLPNRPPDDVLDVAASIVSLARSDAG